MKMKFKALLAAVLIMTPMFALAQSENGSSAEGTVPVKVVASQALSVTTPKGTGALPLFVSLDWSKPQPDVTRALLVFHGKLRNADVYYASGEKAVATANAKKTTIVIAPQFLQAPDAEAFHLAPGILRWSNEGWTGGDDAMSPAPISSFAAIDAILMQLANRTLFPNLTEVIVAGHSAGGQVVQRYAVAGRGESALTKAGVHVRYVVANPSSYVYFSAERPLAGGGFGPFEGSKKCSGYDKWKYGVNDPPPYIGDRSFTDLEKTYAKRDVVYLLGDKDIDPNHPALDKSCMGEAEGAYRLQRGMDYFHYMQLRHPQGMTQQLWTVPGIAHDGDGMFNSKCGLSAIFDQGVCTTQVK
jgi:pimeloyl-ACP methyl ester carboxylesterase